MEGRLLYGIREYEDVRIGEGASGFLEGQRVFFKAFAADDDVSRMRFINEANVLHTFRNHPNIAYLYGVSTAAQERSSYYLITKQYPYDILDFFDSGADGEVSGEALKQIALKICSTVQFLHEQGLVHGDIKSANVLLSHDLTPKLCDFESVSYGSPAPAAGPAVPLNEVEVRSTAYYLAPEVGFTHPVSYQSDIYSLGILLNELASGDDPTSELGALMRGRPGASIQDLVRQGARPRIDSSVSEELKRIIELCWSPLPDDRPTASEVCYLLNAAPFPDF